MSAYKIFETQNFQKELVKFTSLREQQLITKKLSAQVYPQLKKEPHYGNHIKKLRAYDPESWRYRIGNFRLFYSIDEKAKVVVISSLRLRKEAYR